MGINESPYSNVDIATMMTFSTIVRNQTTLSHAHFDELLVALNAMRNAAGWATVNWQQVLPSNVPPPSAGELIRAAHITSLRREMNNAMQALGAFVAPYLDSDPFLQVFKVEYVMQLQQRAQ